MQDATEQYAPDWKGLSKSDWLVEFVSMGEEYGFAQSLGKRHHASFIDEGDTLLVTFETLDGARALSANDTPLGYELLRSEGWSHLCVISEGDTWFRAPQIYGFFDRLIDDGFFDEFEKVIFYGAGPCGYAAASYSVAAPGAIVLTIQPQATLDPRVTEWDDRFTHMRRTSFTDRYGYAPDMLDAASQAHVIYDPREDLDAMHAALFTRPNCIKHRMPNMGDALQGDLLGMDKLTGILSAAGNGTLDTMTFARAMRARRDHAPYLRRVLARLDIEERDELAKMLCRNVVARLNAPRFQRRLDRLNAEGSDPENEDSEI